jgi:hypothetical protein
LLDPLTWLVLKSFGVYSNPLVNLTHKKLRKIASIIHTKREANDAMMIGYCKRE